MAAPQSISSSQGYVSYLDKIDNTLWGYPSSFYQRISSLFKQTAPLHGEYVLLTKQDIGSLPSLLEETSLPYKAVRDAPVDEIKGEIWTDFGRIGQPDEFWLNGKKIERIKTTDDKERFLTLLKESVHNSEEALQRLVQIFNFRPKIWLVHRMGTAFAAENKEIRPIIGRNGYKISRTTVDSERMELTCEIEGTIERGLTGDLEGVSISKCFKAKMTYHSPSTGPDLLETSYSFSEPQSWINWILSAVKRNSTAGSP